MASTTTYFIGSYYEVTAGVATKYYYSGGQRVAMRKNDTLYYMFSDHLGSTSITTDSAGNVVSELRYKPWGETRYAGGNTPTQYTFTGQRDYTSDFGLMYFNARWVDPSIGRFAQADTVIPQGQGVQAWDRYAYTNNSPVNFTDPSGHYRVENEGGGGCSTSGYCGGSSLDSISNDDEGNNGYEITLIDTQVNANALLDFFGWTPSGLIQFAKVMDVSALAVDSALLIGVYSLALTGAVVGGVSGIPGGPEGIVAGIVLGAIKGWKTGEGLASPFLVIGNSLATTSTIASILSDEATGNAGIKLTLGIGSNGVDVDGEIRVPGSLSTSVLLRKCLKT